MTVMGMMFASGYGLRTVVGFASRKEMSSSRLTSLREVADRRSPPQAADKDEDLRPAQTYFQVLGLLKDNYVEKITPEDEQKMARESVRWMIQALEDPESRFMEPSEHEILKANRRGEYYGIGAILTVRRREVNKIPQERLMVVTPMPGSPAAKAGLQPGDIITHIDGHWIIASNPLLEEVSMFNKLRNKEINQEQFDTERNALRKRVTEGITRTKALDLLSGRATRSVTLTVERAGEDSPLKITLQCAPVTVKPIEYRLLPQKVAYLAIHQFMQGGENEMDRILKEIQQQKAARLILDIRNNPGGSLEVAVRMASRFVAGGSLGALEMSKGRHRVLTPVGGKHPIFKGSVVLMANKGTAGAAEVFAAALRDRGVCRIVGQPTFGDSAMQTLITLNDGSALTITTARYLSPRGIDFAQGGLKPDTVATNPTGQDDPQMEAALRIAQAG